MNRPEAITRAAASRNARQAAVLRPRSIGIESIVDRYLALLCWKR
jgi:hypothetical protein